MYVVSEVALGLIKHRAEQHKWPIDTHQPPSLLGLSDGLLYALSTADQTKVWGLLVRDRLESANSLPSTGTAYQEGAVVG